MQSLLNETPEGVGVGMGGGVQSCHGTEHYKHVESHVVSQDCRIFSPPLRDSICVRARLRAGVRVNTHAGVRAGRAREV